MAFPPSAGAPAAPPPAAPASAPSGEVDPSAVAIASLVGDACSLACELDPACAAAMANAQVCTVTFNPDGSVDVDVDGTTTTVPADSLGTPDDAAPPTDQG